MAEVKKLPFVCEECGKEFTKNVGLQSHKKAHRPMMKCKHCGKEVRSLDTHMLRMHSAETQASDIEQTLRGEVRRLRDIIGRQEKEIQRYKGVLIRNGLMKVSRSG